MASAQFQSTILSIPTPSKDARCQDLIAASDVIHHGVLRRSKALHQKLRQLLPNTQLLKWTREYVVLHGGCIYLFNNELSEKPDRAFSLYGFTRVTMCEDHEVGPGVSWPFKVVSDVDFRNRTFYFSSPSQLDAQKWVDHITQQMMFANGASSHLTAERSPSITSSELRSLSKTTAVVPPSIRPRLPVPEQDLETGDWSDPDDDDKYDKPEEIRKALRKGDAFKNDLSKVLAEPKSPRAVDKPKPQPPTKSRPQPASPTATTFKNDLSKVLASPEPVSPPPKPAKQALLPPRGTRPIPTPLDPSTKPKQMVRPFVSGEQSKPPPPPVKPKTAVKPVARNAQPEESEDELDYTEITDQPYDDNANISGGSASRQGSRDLFEASYWRGSPDEGEKLMKCFTMEGVYMIRDSSEPGQKTLLVYIDHMVRKFKIQTDASGRFYIDAHGPHFRTVAEMLEHYTANNLPQRSLRLTQPFSAVR